MKAPRELTEAFKEGVDEREAVAFLDEGEVQCWLAQFDPAQRPCEGRFERVHFLNRQRVRHALFALLPDEYLRDPLPGEEMYGPTLVLPDWTETLQSAEWDSRNGGIGCEAHHRRFDKHLVSLPSEELVVPRSALPEHVEEFAADWGLEDELDARFPGEKGAQPHEPT